MEVEFHFKELCKKKSKFTGEQRVRILMEVEAGARIAETFSVNDEFNRESMKIEIDGSLPSARVIRALGGWVDCVALQATVPGRWARVHQGCTKAMDAATCRQQPGHMQPGKPTQYAYIERFNRTFRTEALDRFVSTTLDWTKPAVATGTGVTATTANGHIGHRAAGNIVARKLTRSALSALPTACS